MMKKLYSLLLFANYFTILFFLGLFLTPSVLSAQSGSIFRDYNANGTKDAGEPFVSGVIVKAYNSAGALCASITSAGTTAPNYTLPTTCTGQVRVEFQIPTTNTNPSGPLSGVDFTSYGGASYGSSVQFVVAGAANVHFAINVPNDYWISTKDHRYVLPCYVNGTATGTAAGDAAIVSTPYSSSGLNSGYSNYNGVVGTGVKPRVDATVAQVGTVWGAAYNKNQKHHYFSTFLKRHSGMADGPGYIYNFDYSGATPVFTGKFNLEGATPNNGGAAIALGTVTRTGGANYTLPSDKTLPSVDLDAFGKVAAMSFGDLDMQPSTNYLWAVNLFQKALIRIDVSGNPVSLPTGIEQYILSGLPGYPTSTKGQLRPWALSFNAGKGYLGVVDDASTGVDADLKAYVLQFDPNNIAAGFTTMLSFDPNIKRGTLASDIKFHKWINTYAEPPVTINGAKRFYTQPVLSDIDFDENGNMYLSFFDRFAHQVGYFNYTPVSGSTTTVRAYGYGEILKACATTTGWAVEGTGACSTGAEFFQDIAGDSEPESSEGASAILKGKNQILEIAIDPHPQGTTGSNYWNTQGTYTYNLSTGAIDNWYSVYSANSLPLYGKTNGLGDIEFLTDIPPIEIGNRVWNDANRNGVQDAGEAGINGVIVELYDGATKVGTSTTNATGNFYFNKTNTILGGAIEVKPKTAYTIKIAATQFNNSGIAATPLSSFVLTTANATSPGLAGVADNNATVVGGLATISYTTGNYGENNHTLDFGFFNCPTITTPSSAQTLCANATGSNITVATNANTANLIRFVKFTSDQMAGATPTVAEAAAIYAGTAIATVTPTGAASPFTATYTWNTADFPNTTSASITYYVYAVLNPDLGVLCRPIQEIAITVKPLPALAALSTPDICEGTTLNILATQNAAWTYAWKKGGVTVSTANPFLINTTTVANGGSYQLVVTQAGCQATATTSVTINPAVIATIIDAPIACMGGTSSANIHTNITGGTPSIAYSWTRDPSPTVVSTASNPVFNLAGFYHLLVTDAKGCTSMASINIATPDPISTSNIVGNVACNGASTGKIVVSVSGGMVPFTLIYKQGTTVLATHSVITAPVIDSLTNLPAGTYNVEVMDANGCMVTIMGITITQPPALTVACSGTDETLYHVSDGTANVNAAGGSPSYTYLWSNGATTSNISGLAAANYTVTVTDVNGCTATCSNQVDTFPCSHITLSPSPLPDGHVGQPYNVQLNATGGTTPYQYQWKAGVSGVLPNGLSIDANGLISGTPTTMGTYATKVLIKDIHECPDSLDPAILIILCTTPAIADVTADTATCINGVVNDNAAITVTGIANGVSYTYGTNGTTGLFATNATPLTGNTISLTDLPNPSVSTTYTIRVYSLDTLCYNDTTVVLTPSVCPPCSITATFIQNACDDNSTTAITTDDYFTVTVSNVTSINGGTSGKYEVVLNGNVLNTGGTAYGTSVNVGITTTFKSDGATTYALTVRDLDIPTCTTTVFTTTASSACSTIPCKPEICLPATVTRAN
jgi:trimeric autotransporter adhesin